MALAAWFCNSTLVNMQCKDIPDAPILRFLEQMNGRRATWFDYDPRPENTVLHAMPSGTPPKLVLAKMRMMIRRKIVDGCPCGCRGDFVITDSGKAMLLSLQNARNLPRDG